MSATVPLFSGTRKPLASANQPRANHRFSPTPVRDTLHGLRLLLASQPCRRCGVRGGVRCRVAAQMSKAQRKRNGPTPKLARGARRGESRPHSCDPWVGRWFAASNAAALALAPALGTAPHSGSGSNSIATAGSVAGAAATAVAAPAASAFASSCAAAEPSKASILAAAADHGGGQVICMPTNIGTHCGGQETPPARDATDESCRRKDTCRRARVISEQGRTAERLDAASMYESATSSRQPRVGNLRKKGSNPRQCRSSGLTINQKLTRPHR